ncbi:amylase [Lithospermum erythrorhizon]|uniref:Alpha-amylase n=1 Tax=Lithospermum erythrorhizon TaxID=34254 RepID=A0AAV3QG91_LITER
MLSTVAVEPFFHYNFVRQVPKVNANCKKTSCILVNCCSKALKSGGTTLRKPRDLRLGATSSSADIEVVETSDVAFQERFQIKRPEKIEGNITILLDNDKDSKNWQLTVGSTLPGEWILHWGVNYVGDTGSEWDQPPPEMRPPGSVPIKDYAIETPLKRSSSVSNGKAFNEVKIVFNTNTSITALNFVLKDAETGAWYQHRGRDFKIPLSCFFNDDGNVVGAKKNLSIWPGTLGTLSNIGATLKGEDTTNDSREPSEQLKRRLEGFYEEHHIVKETFHDNLLSISVKKCPKTANNLLLFETDIPGDVVVHWGVCKDENKKWELPEEPYPSKTTVFKNKALRTLLQQKEGAHGSEGLFTLDESLTGFIFVLKLNDNTWLNCSGKDFYIPLPGHVSQHSPSEGIQEIKTLSSSAVSESCTGVNQEVSTYTDEIISEIRNLVTDISSEKRRKTKSKEAQEDILQEIEKLAAEAYSIFRGSVPAFAEVDVAEPEVPKPPEKHSSGTGSGYEILCQGFNWESHKSGRWYMELHEKASELSSLGFTVVWLPPPTESVSPEGYMPKDLYNLNSRYGNIEELKSLVKKFHEDGIRVLGDVVLNHRCAHSKNQNGIWNIFGGRLNWDDRAVVSDDPHFQGRGNKSSGDNFHAAPNIDHSQEFVRNDIKEWLCWLRKEIGYDGWRLDFVRGFWGGYVKDYLDATEPYFAVGEYWDSLSYTYGEMDYNQDAHRQRIVDWINDTNGFAGAFDVTTKGILHSVLQRCEYWRLSDQKGKPPGVLGWWPSRAVTFIENHDTGSTQGHWRFPGGKEMQGYAYILTHPGTPSVFYDHLFSHYRSQIAQLLSLRKKNKIHCRSTVKISKAERDVYAAIVDDKVAMKIGPGHYEPPSEAKKWSLAIEGKDYKVWEAS